MRQKLIGVIVAVLLHLLVAIALCQDSIINWLLPRPKAEVAVVEEKVKPVMSFTISPRKEVVAKPVPKVPVKPKHRYNRTTADQPQQKPKQAKFIGAHDTVAQSSAEAKSSAPDIAAVNGADRKHLSSQSDFSKGKLRDESVSKPQKSNPAAQPILPDATPKKTAESRSSKQLAEYLKLLNKKPAQPHTVKPKVKNRQVKLQKADKPIVHPKEKQLRSKLTKPKVVSSKAAFKPRIDATKNIGSVIRKGKVSSNDTVATPEGRYKKAVLDAIYKDWNRRMGRHPDLTLPGVLEIRWYVYAPGKVKGIRPVTEKHGSAIQKGITFQAINQAKIPTMPVKLKKQLNGDPMEFQVTFYF